MIDPPSPPNASLPANDGAIIRKQLESMFGDRATNAMEKSIIDALVEAWTETGHES
jgi:hypothetical protein